MPKATTPKAARGEARRHNPLEDDIVATGVLKTKSGKRKSKDADGETQDGFVDPRASRNILRMGREFAEEEEANKPKPPTVEADNFGYDSRFDEAKEEQDKVYADDDDAWGDEDEEVEEIEVDPEDLETYKKFMPDAEQDDLIKHGWDRQPSGGDEDDEEPVNLADLILAKIAAHEAGESGKPQERDEEVELPPKVVEAYTK